MSKASQQIFLCVIISALLSFTFVRLILESFCTLLLRDVQQPCAVNQYRFTLSLSFGFFQCCERFIEYPALNVNSYFPYGAKRRGRLRWPAPRPFQKRRTVSPALGQRQ